VHSDTLANGDPLNVSNTAMSLGYTFSYRPPSVRPASARKKSETKDTNSELDTSKRQTAAMLQVSTSSASATQANTEAFESRNADSVAGINRHSSEMVAQQLEAPAMQVASSTYRAPPNSTLQTPNSQSSRSTPVSSTQYQQFLSQVSVLGNYIC
jgi:hypothetical protein